MKKGIYTLIIAAIAVLVRSSLYVFTPLYLDYFNSNHTAPTHENKSSCNTSTHNSIQIVGTSAIFLVVGNRAFALIVYAIWLIAIKVCAPTKIGETERNYPKQQIFLISFSQGISSILFIYSLSGSRNPLYLQGILQNVNIPIQFATR